MANGVAKEEGEVKKENVKKGGGEDHVNVDFGA